MFGRFESLSIQLKASAAAAVLLVCLLALGTNAYLTSLQSTAGLRALSQNLLVKQQGIAALDDAAVATHMKIFRYVSWASNGVSDRLMKSLYADINGDLRSVADRIADLARRNDLSDPEREDLLQLSTKWQDCTSKAEDTIEVGRTDAAMATMMLSETDDAFKAVDTDLQNMSRVLAGAENELSNQLYAAAQRNKLIIIIGTLGGLLVSVFVAVVVGRSIVGPIRRITGVMQRLSAGETDVEIGGRERRDEIGRMVEAIDVFRGNIIEQRRMEQALTDELRAALDQQTATAEVLQVIINSRRGDLEPVFEVLLEKATRLCGADFAAIAIRDGDILRYVAAHGTTAEVLALLREHKIVPGRGTIAGRVVLERDVVHIPDCEADPEYEATRVASLAGSRTALGVPLLREGEVVGSIALLRQRVEPYTEAQIELVRGFGTQAVIALENARLLAEIRQRQAELRVTFDNMDHGVAMFDAELRLAAWNRNFQAILDLPDAFLGQSMTYADFIRQLAERGEFGTEADPAAEVTGHMQSVNRHFAFERTRPDGTVLEVRHSPMPEGGFVLIYSDITERKRSEIEIRAARDAAEISLQELTAAQAKLIQAEKMASLGQLTAGIAHEIKNPLNFVNNFASLSVDLLSELREAAGPAIAALGAETREEIDETIGLLTGNLEKISEHGRRADNIVKSMLEHSRGVTGERREVDFNGLIEEGLNLAYHGARARDETFNISVERAFDPALKPIALVPQDMTRVLLNLFSNGFYAANKRAKADANPGYRPTLMVTTREDGDAVEVKVRDNGSGIPADIRDKLFQPFFTTKPTGEGTGLGLSISYDIVTQEHAGTIEVESEPGEFTEFTVRLPRRQSAVY